VELPAGLRDGFGDAGALDHRALVHQTMHRHPLVGGFVARASDRLRARYADTPFLRTVMLLSAGSSEAGTLRAADAAGLGIGYLVINRDTFSNEAFSRETLEREGFSFVTADGGRELYAFARPDARK
jgi:hypothetical protein